MGVREGIKFNKKMYFFVGDWKNLTIIYLLVALDAQSTEICGRDSVRGGGTHLYNLPACIYDLLSVCVGGVCVCACLIQLQIVLWEQ